MQVGTDMTYQGSASKTDSVGSYTKNDALSKVTGDIQEARKEQTEEEKKDTEQPSVSIQSNETLKRAVNEINQRTDTEAVFGFHDATNRVTIKIVDKKSKEVVREYPPEETLDMIAKVWELAGILVDEKR